MQDDDVLIPEFPLTYLWWEACFQLHQTMAPLVPIESQRVALGPKTAQYAREAAVMNLAAVQVYDAGRPWNELFVNSTMAMIA